MLELSWPAGDSQRAWLTFNLQPGEPLFEAMGIGRGAEPILRRVDPFLSVTIGERDPQKAAQGYVFFDNPRQRPHETHLAKFVKQRARVLSEGSRTTIAIDEISFGSFRGHLEITVYPGSPLLHVHTVASTDEKFRAIVYDAGLVSEESGWHNTAWLEPHGRLQKSRVDAEFSARPLAVKHRVIVAEGEAGSLAVFPEPHRYFYPLDFANNFEFTWFGRGYTHPTVPYGLGIRQPLEGDKRFVPWFDAPEGTKQRLGIFYLLSRKDAAATIDQVAAYTRADKFKRLPGHLTFTSHYHVEHTDDFAKRQKGQGATSVPKGLEAPGFVTKFKETGADIVHLAEFHFGHTPRQKAEERLPLLKIMHDECQRLSDEEILILPGEEPNVHLGGHWISFFPKPVYWILNRADGEPFEQELEGYGTVYRVGSPEDVLRLMQKENGLMWTAHARIKSSRGFPDNYRDTQFFKSPHFLGAAWKAMPADLSRPTLGWRVLDLLDDMNNWGEPKQILGEVDVFRVELDYELYAHMNMNYLRMDKLPRFEEGWQPVLDTLRRGEFFVTTGEILIPKFTVAGKESGETLTRSRLSRVPIEAALEWTFPLAFAEIVSGDGEQVYREKIDLIETKEFGSRTLKASLDLTGRKWVRLEVWDVAANGAFTQPVWIQSE